MPTDTDDGSELVEVGPYEDPDLPYINYECPDCGFAICEWTQCPDCGWYDGETWDATLGADGGTNE